MTAPAKKNLLHQAISGCLRSIPIFEDLGASELALITTHMHVIRIDKGNYVFKEGDPGESVCFVVDGTLEVVKTNDKGAQKKIAKLTNGSSIGEMAVVGQFPRSASVKAITEATLLTLTRDRFNQICFDYPWIGVKILRAIAQLLSIYLRKTSKNLSELMPPE
jgi:CRP/FNR family transcriptional regulator, cyclic AMP receptor protein